MERILMMEIKDLTPRKAVELLNEEVKEIKDHIHNKCPIRVDAIQFYAEMYEQSNQYYNQLIRAVNAMSDLMKDHHLALITILKRLGVDTTELEQFEPLDFLPLNTKNIIGDNNYE